MLPLARRLCCTLLLALLFGQVAQAATLEISGYRFWVLPAQKNQEILVNGRIEGGAPCQALHLEIKLLGDRGDKALVRTVVREAGGFGSRLIEGKIKSRAAAQHWAVDEVKLRCKER
jgi:hypothetical protein